MSDPIPNTNLAAAILAGGQSRRMGRNKALIEIRGRTMIERTADLARNVTNQVFISSSDSQPYRFLKLPVVPDIFPDQGPLAGLHATMTHTDRALLLLLASDLPKIHDALIQRLIESTTGSDIVVPRTSEGRLHPLCGIYRRSCLKHVEHNLRRCNNKVLDLLLESRLRVRVLEGAEWPFQDSDLMNLNEPGMMET